MHGECIGPHARLSLEANRPDDGGHRGTFVHATLTPIAGLLDDGRLHLMTALTPRNQLVEPPMRVQND